jgi:ankyrin repeat protein
MDIGALLAEAADETYGDETFDEQPEATADSPKLSAKDILKSSAAEVAHDDRISAKLALQNETDRIVIDQKKKDVSKKDTESKASEEVNASTSHNEYQDEGDGNVSDDSGDDNDVDPELDTELMIASYRGDIRKVENLLSSGARYFARDRHRWTALMWAASGGYDDIIEVLISCVEKKKLRSYLNAKDCIIGWTALHVSRQRTILSFKDCKKNYVIFFFTVIGRQDENQYNFLSLL